MRHVLGLLAAAFALALAACDGGDGGLSACDDPLPSLCVEVVADDGGAITPDRVEVFDGDASVMEVECAHGECCTQALQTGTYTVEVEWMGRVQRRQVDVENSHACDHEVARPRFEF